MRFVVRKGTDPIARADATLLKAIGLPFGGVLKVGRTHLLVQGGNPAESTAIEVGPIGLGNAGVIEGQSVEGIRAVLGPAEVIVIDAPTLVADAKVLVRTLQGRPVSSGDRIELPGSYLGRDEPLTLTAKEVTPDGAGLVGAGTRFVTQDRSPPVPLQAGEPIDQVTGVPSTAEALLAGLEAEKDLLTGWLSLLTSPENLPAAWGLPRVAGVLLEGPHGCGKSELVAAAAAESGAKVHEVNVDQVFKPERLLDLLETAVKSNTGPLVIFVDRLEAVAGEEGLAPFKTQVGAVLRWFLDAVVEKP
ncbi:MAG: AAA family ATPase, partial [Acidimicrobiia bacterium]